MPSPFAADDVLDDEVDLRPVESGFAGFKGEWHAERFGGVLAGLFGGVPLFGQADVLGAVGIAQADANAIILHTDGAKYDFDQFQAAGDFARHLFLGTDEVGVVLREAADARHAAKLAALLEAIDGAESERRTGRSR